MSELVARHSPMGLRLARARVVNPSDAEDVLSSAVADVYAQMTDGKGPTDSFRSYFLTVISRKASRTNQDAAKVLPVADNALLDEVVEPDEIRLDIDTDLVRGAFQALPERWQEVLWYLEIDEVKPAEAAALMGMSSNAVSALALRARRGLRRSFVQTLRSKSPTDACNRLANTVEPFIRSGDPLILPANLHRHVASCASCSTVVQQLAETKFALRMLLVPALVGVSASTYQGMANTTAASLPAATGGFLTRGRLLTGLIGVAAAAVLLGILLVPHPSPSPSVLAPVPSFSAPPITAGTPTSSPSLFPSRQPTSSATQPAPPAAQAVALPAEAPVAAAIEPPSPTVTSNSVATPAPSVVRTRVVPFSTLTAIVTDRYTATVGFTPAGKTPDGSAVVTISPSGPISLGTVKPAAGWSCSPAGAAWSCRTTQMAANSSASFTFSVTREAEGTASFSMEVSGDQIVSTGSTRAVS
nr:sigma-70 family RNA polymerase sigma factor [Psychromicrobium silvestre]